MMPVIECNGYSTTIAEYRNKEEALIHKANHTAKSGDLMAITIKYQHINSKLRGVIQDQKYCYLVKKLDIKEAKSWRKNFPNGFNGDAK